jgi:hypothetical protein
MFVWELPEFSSSPVLHGWNLAAMGEFQTGQPFTVNTAVLVITLFSQNTALGQTVSVTQFVIPWGVSVSEG